MMLFLSLVLDNNLVSLESTYKTESTIRYAIDDPSLSTYWFWYRWLNMENKTRARKELIHPVYPNTKRRSCSCCLPCPDFLFTSRPSSKDHNLWYNRVSCHVSIHLHTWSLYHRFHANNVPEYPSLHSHHIIVLTDYQNLETFVAKR